MKIYNQIGSKERFVEMFQGVNKMKLNEDFTILAKETGNLAEAAFDELVQGKLEIEQTNSQASGDINYVEIVGVDSAGNIATFKFSAQSTQGEQDGVSIVNTAKIISFNVKGNGFSVDMPETEKSIIKLNAEREKDIVDVVSEYTTTDDNIPDEVFEEAVKFIDKVPYKKGTEQMQTNKAYADQKPTNKNLRVNSPELEKYLSEMDVSDFDDEEDILALPPDYSTNDIPQTDDQIDQLDSEEEQEELSAEEQAQYSQAYDNLVASGNESPTGNEIAQEVDKLNGVVKPIEKKRTIPRGAEHFWEGNSIVTNMDVDDVAKQGYENLLSNESKEKIINHAKEILDQKLGIQKFQIPKEEYFVMVKDLAMQLYTNGSTAMNETDYPKQLGIGKEFKTVSDYPTPKKKYKKKQTRIKEEDIESDEIEQLTKDKEEAGDMISGGLADDKLPNEFCPIQVAKGMKVEMEHTDNPLIAVEIVMDHLTEDPKYYGEDDEDPDKMAQKNAEKDSEEKEEEDGDKKLTDELLGYASHNVGEEFDYAAAERDYHDREDMRQNPEDYGDDKEHPLADIMNNDGSEEDLSKLNNGEKGKNLAESEKPKEIITEEQVKTARLVLKDRNFLNEMTKEEAVKILIKHNIK